MLTVADVPFAILGSLLQRYRLDLEMQADDEPIVGSFWGDSEAGIVGRKVYVRADTPLHSLLHETCHIICMTEPRRAGLDRDAGGDDLEEAAVCFLQLILADEIEGAGHDRLIQDMDEWGYSFRLGNTRDWFERDAEDAEKFLINYGLIDHDRTPTFKLRR